MGLESAFDTPFHSFVILQEASTGQGWQIPHLDGNNDTQVKALSQHIVSLRQQYDDVQRRIELLTVCVCALVCEDLPIPL